MKKAGWFLIAALCLFFRAAWAGPNGGGTLVMHNAQVDWLGGSYCGQGNTPLACAEINAEVDGSGPAANGGNGVPKVWKVFAAFPTGSSPRLKGLSFGIHYPAWGPGDPGGIVMVAHGACIGDPGQGGFELPGPDWPGSDTGTIEVLENVQTGLLAECYWFAAYTYDRPNLFQVRDNPAPQYGGAFADDSTPIAVFDPIAGYGSLGFDEPGMVVCPASQGSCCDLKQGTCTLTTPPDCAALGNTFGYYGLSSCDPNPCPTTGPCCMADANGHAQCVIMTPQECVDERCWAFFGLCGQTCNGDPPCLTSTPIGACCTDGACSITYRENCNYPSFFLLGIPCCPNLCMNPPTGACCTRGVCSIATYTDCINGNGEWQGPLTECTPATCQRGTCCDSDGDCTMKTQDLCLEGGGGWNGPGGSCSPNPCLGACCAAGICVETTAAGCPPPGTWQGPGSSCGDPEVCTLGACCDPATGICTLTTPAGCMPPKVRKGPNTSCDPNPCMPPVPVEVSTWGKLKARYR